MINFILRCIARLLFFTWYFFPIKRLSFIKRFSIKIHGVTVDSSTNFSPGIYILNGRNVAIGSNGSIGYACTIIDTGKLIIGDNCLVSSNVSFIAGSHKKFNYEEKLYPSYEGDIIIGDNVWIGANSIIVGPCEIGSNTIIGACSFVSGKFPAKCLIAGSPAKIKKYY